MVKDFPNLFWLLYKFSNRIQMRKCPVKTTTPRRILCNSNFTSQSIRRKRSTQKTYDPQNRRPFHSRNIVCRRHEKTSCANSAKSWRRWRCAFLFRQCRLCRRLCHPIFHRTGEGVCPTALSVPRAKLHRFGKESASKCRRRASEKLINRPKTNELQSCDAKITEPDGMAVVLQADVSDAGQFSERGSKLVFGAVGIGVGPRPVFQIGVDDFFAI